MIIRVVLLTCCIEGFVWQRISENNSWTPCELTWSILLALWRLTEDLTTWTEINNISWLPVFINILPYLSFWYPLRHCRYGFQQGLSIKKKNYLSLLLILKIRRGFMCSLGTLRKRPVRPIYFMHLVVALYNTKTYLNLSFKYTFITLIAYKSWN